LAREKCVLTQVLVEGVNPIFSSDGL